MGGGQYGALWGSDYRQTINDNMLVVIMIETPLGRGQCQGDRRGARASM